MKLYRCATCKVGKPLSHYFPHIRKQYPNRGPRPVRCRECHASAVYADRHDKDRVPKKEPFPETQFEAVQRVMLDANDQRAIDNLLEAVEDYAEKAG